MPYPIVEAVPRAVDGAERTLGRHPAGANKGAAILALRAHLDIDPADGIHHAFVRNGLI
ncbi:hypothetical protein [Microbacterium lacticum]